MPGAFLYDDRVRDAVALTALTPTATGMPVSNLRDPQPRARTRFPGQAAAVLVDFGAATPVEAVALLSTNLGPTATLRWQLGALEGLQEASPLLALDFTALTPASMAGWSATRGGSGTGEATYFDSTGSLVVAGGSDWRVAHHDPVSLARLGLLIEPARTNAIRNPRAIDATAGTPGTHPTNWAVSVGTGMSWQVAGTGTENGLPYVDYRITGTAVGGGASFFAVFPETATAVTAASGESWTASHFHKLVAGGGATGNVLSFLIECTSTGSTVRQGSQLVASPQATARLSAQRVTQTMALSGGATVARIRPCTTYYFLAGAVDTAIRLALPQLERGQFATSPILPAPGSTASPATRNGDAGNRALGSAYAGVTLSVDHAVQAVPTSTGLAEWSVKTYTIAAPQSQTLIRGYVDATGYGTDGYMFNGAGFVAGYGGLRPALGGLVRYAITNDPANGAAAGNGTAYNPYGPGGTMPGLDTLGVFAGEAVLTLRAIRLYGTRLTNGQIRALSASGSSLDATALSHDSGVLPADTGDEANGNVVALRTGAATGRYLRLEIADPAAQTIDLGLLVAGPLWRLARGVAYGVREGRVVLDQRDRNPLTGAEFVVPALANPRFAGFTLPALSRAEVADAHRDLVRRLGAARDALWIPETADARVETNRRTIWGAVNQPGEEAAAARGSFALLNRALRIVERL